MNVSEGVGTLYSFGYFDHASLMAPGPAVKHVGVYVDCFGALSIGGRTLAVKGVAARGRHSQTLDSPAALQRIAATVGWYGSVYGLVLDNVRSPAARVEHTAALAVHAVHPSEPGYQPLDRCRPG